MLLCCFACRMIRRLGRSWHLIATVSMASQQKERKKEEKHKVYECMLGWYARLVLRNRRAGWYSISRHTRDKRNFICERFPMNFKLSREVSMNNKILFQFRLLSYAFTASKQIRNQTRRKEKINRNLISRVRRRNFCDRKVQNVEATTAENLESYHLPRVSRVDFGFVSISLFRLINFAEIIFFLF